MYRRRGQATAEYAILVGVVIALAAGVLGLILKGEMSYKQRQGANILHTAGQSSLGSASGLVYYTQEARNTTVDAKTYRDVAVMRKGGYEEKLLQQRSNTTSITVEMRDALP